MHRRQHVRNGREMRRLGQRRTRIWPPLFLVALVLALFAFTGSAAAVDVLDQQQISTANGGNVQFHGPLSLSQTFTAGHTAPLAKISVYIGGWSPYLMRAEIWSSSGMLGFTHLTVTNYTSHWQDITFAPAPTLTAGARYSIVLTWVGNSFIWWFGGSNPYSGGAVSFGDGSWDMCFKTYYYVADTTPPVVTPPANVTADAPSSAGVAVNFGSASATDDIDGTLPASAIHYHTDYGTSSQAEVHSGDTFPIGTTTVTAADSSGNTGTATFNITVWTDTTPPTVTPPDNLTVEAVSSAGAEAIFGSASASDNVDGTMPATSIHYYTGYGTDDQAEVHSGDQAQPSHRRLLRCARGRLQPQERYRTLWRFRGRREETGGADPRSRPDHLERRHRHCGR